MVAVKDLRKLKPEQHEKELNVQECIAAVAPRIQSSVHGDVRVDAALQHEMWLLRNLAEPATRRSRRPRARLCAHGRSSRLRCLCVELLRRGAVNESEYAGLHRIRLEQRLLYFDADQRIGFEEIRRGVCEIRSIRSLDRHARPRKVCEAQRCRWSADDS